MGQAEPPTLRWEKLIHTVRQQEDQMEKKWAKWTLSQRKEATSWAKWKRQ